MYIADGHSPILRPANPLVYCNMGNTSKMFVVVVVIVYFMTLGNYVARPMLNMFKKSLARQVTCIKLPPTTNECHKIKASKKAAIQRSSSLLHAPGRGCAGNIRGSAF